MTGSAKRAETSSVKATREQSEGSSTHHSAGKSRIASATVITFAPDQPLGWPNLAAREKEPWPPKSRCHCSVWQVREGRAGTKTHDDNVNEE